MNRVIYYLACREFFLPFKTLFKKRTPGGRDFFWLTILVTLIFSCSLLLYSMKQGLTDRFVDILLGSVPNAGIPIWIQPSPYGMKQYIDEGLLAQINDQAEKLKPLAQDRLSIEVFPYSNIGSNFIALPNTENTWRNKQQYFKGIAVYEEDPLWRHAMQDNNDDHSLLMQMVLSRSLVEKHFDYPVYLNYLAERNLPNSLSQQIPQTMKAFLSDEHPILWMEFRIPGEATSELLPVKVTWVERLPIPGNHVFLFSARFYHALKFSHFDSKLRYFPETAMADNTFNGSLRISGLMFTENSTAQQREQLSECLDSGQFSEANGFFYLKLRRAKPEFYYKACREQLSLDDSLVIPESYKTSDIIYETRGITEIRCSEWPKSLMSVEENTRCQKDTQWTLQREMLVISTPCGNFPSYEWTASEREACRDDPSFHIQRRMTETVENFLYAFLYVPNRTQLNDALTLLDDIPGKPLFLTATYEDSLKRFGALSEILLVLGGWFTGLAGLFLLVLLYVQLATLIGHRRHAYGILLVKGISHRELYAMLRVQLSFVVIIGFTGAFILTWSIRYLLERGILEVAGRFKSVLTLGQGGQLPIALLDYLAFFIGGLGVILLLTLIIMRRLPLNRKTAPEELLDVA